VATLVAIRYADQVVAEDARKSVQELEDELTIQADHVASISRDVEGRYHAHISHIGTSAGGAGDCGSFWAGLFGLLFSLPVAGLAVDAGSGTLGDRLGEEEIDKAFRNQVREQVKPGTSAVFIVTESTAPDKAVAALARYGGTVSETTLSDAQFKQLRLALQTPTPAD
jgi:uncharacterized membrane protein